MRVAVLGERVRVEGYALAGAIVCPADDPEEVRAAWIALPDDVAVVVLTPAAARALDAEGAAESGTPPGRDPAVRRPDLLTAVLPP